MKRILFVDDDPNTLNGLRRGLYSMRYEWQLDFEVSGKDALHTLADAGIDVVVTDVRMPGMDGLQLLRKAKKACPQAARIVLSGKTQPDELARSFESTHLFLSKPCDIDMLKRRVRQILTNSEKIRDRSLKSLISQVGVVPSLPILVTRLHKEFKSPTPDVDKIASIVSMDIGMSASVLHLVNSGYFGAKVPVSSPELAVRWLGLETLRNFLITNRLCASLDSSAFKYFDAPALWRDSSARSNAARATVLAQSGNPVLADEAFASSLFHDIGQVVLASILRSSYDDIVRQAIFRGEPLWKVEREFIGSTHAEVGAYLLGLWGLPETVLNAVMSHHHSDHSESELTAMTTEHIG